MQTRQRRPGRRVLTAHPLRSRAATQIEHAPHALQRFPMGTSQQRPSRHEAGREKEKRTVKGLGTSKQRPQPKGGERGGGREEGGREVRTTQASRAPSGCRIWKASCAPASLPPLQPRPRPSMRSQHPELAGPPKRCLGALATVSWPWAPAWSSLEPPRRDGGNAQKGEKTGGKWARYGPKCVKGSGSPGRPAAPSPAPSSAGRCSPAGSAASRSPQGPPPPRTPPSAPTAPCARLPGPVRTIIAGTLGRMQHRCQQ
eukprot:COSAG04_NODE_1405_length_6901_cov_9.408262_3_plen_257_part_00